MATSSLTNVIQRLRQAVHTNDETRSDGELLDCFCNLQEEAAFAVLMHRHGSMVMGVCQRILRNSHDAEDAFQATFLVMVRKAGSLMGRKTVGNWLFGVAYHTALKARAATIKRRSKEQQAKHTAPTGSSDQWQDLQKLLDQELARLPDDYREAIVLCDLEGMKRKDAARKLGWPEGTLSGRLARARVLLSKRLARQGITVSGGLLAMILSQQAAQACVPAPLFASTSKAAACVAAGQAVTIGVVSANVAALTKGVLQAMFISKLKIATFVLVGFCLLTFGALSFSVGNAQEKQSKKARIVEVDLNKLPPDLAKRILELTKKKGGDQQGENDDKQEAKKKAKKAPAEQSGFQGEQQGQHEDKDDVKKSKETPKKGKGQGEQKGQNEDKENTKKKAKKGNNQGQNEDNENGKKKKSKREDDEQVSLTDALRVADDEQQKEDGQQKQKDNGQANQKDDGQKNQKEDGDKQQTGDAQQVSRIGVQIIDITLRVRIARGA